MSAGGRPRVSVVVCTYSEARLDKLGACLEAIRAQRYPADEIVLVVDHNDRLLAHARATYAGVCVVENDRPRGCSGARNCGASHATGDIVAFIDDDACADPGWLEALIAPYDNTTVLGTTGHVVAQWPGRRPSWLPPEFDWVIGCSYQGLPEETAPVRNLWGTASSVRRSVFEEVGGYNEVLGRIGSIPVGCEDTEFCIRVRNRFPDAVFLYVTPARAEHHIDEARARLRYFVRRCYGEGLSKAAVTRSVGTTSGLATERAYVAHVLPAAVSLGLKRAARGELAGLARASAIVLGLAATSVGYLRGTLIPAVTAEGISVGSAQADSTV
ncbi:MAG: glycosyltransferase family 2 protein [Acidimicrobiales bacterium]